MYSSDPFLKAKLYLCVCIYAYMSNMFVHVQEEAGRTHVKIASMTIFSGVTLESDRDFIYNSEKSGGENNIDFDLSKFN